MRYCGAFGISAPIAMLNRYSLPVALVILATPARSETIKRISQPAISPDGSQIAFSWQGDIWTVPRAGGRAERLTVHPGNDTMPRWTPDGSRIVFGSDRFGGGNVMSMSKDGGDLKRLTYDSGTGGSMPYSVSPDGKYVYGQTGAFSATRPNLFRVSINGGDMIRLTDHFMEASYMPVVSPDGKHVYFCRGGYGPGAWQKPGVKSAAMPNIFVADNDVPVTHQHPLERSEATQMFPNFSSDGHIYYVSNESGWPNIWRMNEDGSGKKQLTKHTNGTINNSTVSKDGRFVAYVFESELYVLDNSTGQTSKINVDVPADSRANAVQDLSISTGVNDFAVSPDSKRAVIELRGDLFLLPEKGGTTRRMTTNTAWDGQPAFLDAKTFLYVASDGTKRSIRNMTVDGTSSSFLTDPVADLTHPVVSPDGKSVAYVKGGDEVLVMPSTGGPAKSIVKGSFRDSIQGNAPFSWSSDNKWLVIDKPTALGSSEVVAAEVNGKRRITVARTAHGCSDTPHFLPNGKGVYFIATEYQGNPDLFVVDLLPPDLNFTEDDLDKIDDAKPAKSEPAVDIQEAGIEQRMRRLSTGGDISAAMASPDGRSIFAGTNSGLVSVSVATGATRPVDPAINPNGLTLGPGGQKGYYVSGGKFFSLPLDKPAAVPIAFSADFPVNTREEEKSLFAEVWWAMDRFYYDERMHGKDWNAIKAKYAAIVPFTFDRVDFYNLMGEMMEELDSSHLGSTPPAQPRIGGDATGYIGAEFDPAAIDRDGTYIVKRVEPGSPADHPQSKLVVGDKILTVDGVAPSAQTPLASLLNRKNGHKVALKISRSGTEKTLTIRPSTLANARELAYENWVAWERAETERLSNGKLTYVHIRSMDDPSYERFLREIRTYAVGKKGVIVDVRYNGGGSTAQKLLGVLIKTPWLIRTTRGYDGLKLSENIYRGDSLELPTALLVGSNSFSNAEIMAEGFRRLKRGPIIGERTPGYVIGTGAVQLWDGGLIRMPRIGSFAVDGSDLENNGRKPDFNVWFDPDAWTSGHDTQLEKAVQELLKETK